MIDSADLLRAALVIGMAIVGGFVALARLLIAQLEKRIDQRFTSHEAVESREREGLAARLAAGDRRASDHTERLARIEGTREDGISHRDIGHIHGRIDDLSRQVAETRGEFQAARHTLEIIHEYLLKDGR